MNTLGLQAGAFLPTKPAGLGAAVTVIGLTIMIASHIQITLRDLDLLSRDNFDIHIENRRLAGATFAGGILFVSIGSLQRYQLVVPYMGLLFFTGSLITGVSHVRFWKKVEIFLTKRKLHGNITRKIKYGILSTFIIIVICSLFFELTILNPFNSPLISKIAFTYTLLVLFLSFIGFSKRLLPLREQIDDRLIYGFIITISGTQIFDLYFFNDLIFLIIGKVGYSAGFWLGVYYWLYR